MDSPWVPETVVRGDSVLVCMPHTAGQGPEQAWINVQNLSQDAVASEYYTEYVHLLALITYGRSREVAACTERLSAEGTISYELCVGCMINEEIPPRIRAKYCDLFANTFADSSPQEDKCCAQNLQVAP